MTIFNDRVDTSEQVSFLQSVYERLSRADIAQVHRLDALPEDPAEAVKVLRERINQLIGAKNAGGVLSRPPDDDGGVQVAVEELQDGLAKVAARQSPVDDGGYDPGIMTAPPIEKFRARLTGESAAGGSYTWEEVTVDSSEPQTLTGTFAFNDTTDVLSCSAAVFTSGMVGFIVYATGKDPKTISAYINATSVTVDSGGGNWSGASNAVAVEPLSWSTVNGGRTGTKLTLREAREDNRSKGITDNTIVEMRADNRQTGVIVFTFPFNRPFMMFDGACLLEEANITANTHYTNAELISGDKFAGDFYSTNDGTAGQEEVLLMHLEKPIQMGFADLPLAYGPVYLAIFISGTLTARFTGGTPEAFYYGFGYRAFPCHTDFDVTTATHEWAYTNGNLERGPNELIPTGCRAYRAGQPDVWCVGGSVDPHNDWDPTQHDFKTSALGWGNRSIYPSEESGVGWRDVTIYGVEIRYKTPELWAIPAGQNPIDYDFSVLMEPHTPGSSVWLNPWWADI